MCCVHCLAGHHGGDPRELHPDPKHELWRHSHDWQPGGWQPRRCDCMTPRDPSEVRSARKRTTVTCMVMSHIPAVWWPHTPCVLVLNHFITWWPHHPTTSLSHHITTSSPHQFTTPSSRHLITFTSARACLPACLLACHVQDRSRSRGSGSSINTRSTTEPTS